MRERSGRARRVDEYVRVLLVTIAVGIFFFSLGVRSSFPAADLPATDHSSGGYETLAGPDTRESAGSGEVLDESSKSGEEGLTAGEENEEAKVGIADPLEPFNRAMFYFNDKLYFGVLKPAAQGYNKVVPEKARVSVKNFFSNIAFPIRFLNCLLQANFKGAASETGRFIINTVWGIGGLMDPASNRDIDLEKSNADFGQTLGIYGLGQGFFITWPFFGPSSARDTVGMVGDIFVYPMTYLKPTEASFGVRAYEKVNDVSLSLGEYESLKEAAIDPYIAVRDAYVQYRLQKVEEGRRMK